MSDLAKELEELHRTVVKTVRERLESIDGEVNNDDIRVALQLLKQNQITANLAEVNTEQLKSQMARKLNFSSLKDKVVPLKHVPPQPAA